MGVNLALLCDVVVFFSDDSSEKKCSLLHFSEITLLEWYLAHKKSIFMKYQENNTSTLSPLEHKWPNVQSAKKSRLIQEINRWVYWRPGVVIGNIQFLV